MQSNDIIYSFRNEGNLYNLIAHIGNDTSIALPADFIRIIAPHVQVQTYTRRNIFIHDSVVIYYYICTYIYILSIKHTHITLISNSNLLCSTYMWNMSTIQSFNIQIYVNKNRWLCLMI